MAIVTTNKPSVDSSKVDFATLPTYADNAAALSGGLVVGQLYRTLAGEVCIVV